MLDCECDTFGKKENWKWVLIKIGLTFVNIFFTPDFFKLTYLKYWYEPYDNKEGNEALMIKSKQNEIKVIFFFKYRKKNHCRKIDQPNVPTSSESEVQMKISWTKKLVLDLNFDLTFNFDAETFNYSMAKPPNLDSQKSLKSH